MTDKAQGELCRLAIADLAPSPYQPRLKMHDETIAGIVTGIEKNGLDFPKQAAITVRPLAARGRDGQPLFEIVSGHHRFIACQKAKVETIWAFVVDLSNEEAMMLAATSNTQRPLSAVEHGRHVLRNNLIAERYAKRIGRSAQYVHMAVWAWRVVAEAGGVNSPAAGLNYQVLGTLYGLKDVALRSTLIGLFVDRKPTIKQAINAIQRVKEGTGVWRAVDLSMGSASAGSNGTAIPGDDEARTPSEWHAAVGRRVQAKREALGITREEFGKRVGLTLMQLTMIEVATKYSTGAQRVRLGKALGTSAAWLETGDAVDAMLARPDLRDLAGVLVQLAAVRPDLVETTIAAAMCLVEQMEREAHGEA